MLRSCNYLLCTGRRNSVSFHVRRGTSTSSTYLLRTSRRNNLAFHCRRGMSTSCARWRRTTSFCTDNLGVCGGLLLGRLGGSALYSFIDRSFSIDNSRELTLLGTT